MSRLVVDASVAIKWFLPEVHGDAALRLLEADHTLGAPDLLLPEVGNVLWKRVRRRELAVREARLTLRALLALPLDIHPSGPLMPLALDIACREARSVYDSLYLAAALAWDCPMVTADQRLHQATRGGRLSRTVLWVGDVG